MECEYCKKTFSTPGNLKMHQEKTKRCLKIQNKEAAKIFKCNYCDREFTFKNKYDIHVSRHINDPMQQENERLKRENDALKHELALQTQMNEKTMSMLQENIATLTRENEKIKEALKDAHDKERETLTKLAMKDSTTNYINNYVIKADDLRPISEVELRKHDFDKKYLTQYIIGDGIAKFLLDIMLKDNSFWSDRERKMLSWRFKNILIKDKNAKKLWEVYMNAHGEKLINMLEDEKEKYSTSTTLDTDTKNEFIIYCIQASSDIYKFMEMGDETETERTFCRYLYNNLGSKQELLEKIKAREEEFDQ